MPEKTELHGSLADGQSCRLTLSNEDAVLEIATHEPSGRTMLHGAIADPLFVSLENGKTATLTGNFLAGGYGLSGRGRPFTLTRIGANRVFIGPREFDSGDYISQISFRPTNEFVAQYYRAHRGHARVPASGSIEIDQLFTRNHGWNEVIVEAIDGNRLVICEFSEGNLNVRLGVTIAEATNLQGSTTTESRITHLTYANIVPVDVALHDIINVTHFFSFVVGEVVTPTDVKIELGAEGDFNGRLEFDLHLRFRKPGPELDPGEAGRCLISQPIDGANYAESLRSWLRRRSDWSQSYYLGTETLARKRETSRHRYLDAVGWFESIPLFYMQVGQAVSLAVMRDAARVASNVFAEKGVVVTENRLQQLLAPLNDQSLGTRLRGAMTHLRQRFGAMALPSEAEKKISKITGLRGRLAHGEDPLSSYDSRDIYELTLLVENICQFLTLSDLPWSLDRLNKAHRHPLQENRAILFELARTP